MERRGLAPRIKPLSESAWRSIEARVFEELDRPVPRARPAPPTLGLPALALAAAALVLLPWTGPRAPQSPSSAAKATTASAQAIPAPPTVEAPPSKVTGPQHVSTGESPTRQSIGDSQLTLAERSEVEISGSDAEGWHVRLERGEVHCEIAPRAGRPAFVVTAADVEVRVIGTRFDVVQRGDATRVRVQAGHVQVRHAGRLTLLGPGESWPATTRQTIPTPPARLALPTQSMDRDQQEFERAARLEASDPKRALAIYGRLSHARSSWAANALYARARLLLERDDEHRARAALERYLEKYPTGTNAADARRLLDSDGSR